MSGKLEHGRKDLAEVVQLAMPLSGFAEPLAMIPAGNLVLLTGPGHLIFKSGTLLDERLPSQSGLIMASQPSSLVRVSVRPKRAEDLPKLVAALRQLSASDPAARCRAEEWGEHVVSGLGELHLRTCIGELVAELALSQGPEEQVGVMFQKRVQHAAGLLSCNCLFRDDVELVRGSCQRWSSYMTSRSM